MSKEDKAYPCPCCGYLVFAEAPGSYAICPICFWEDDEVQLRFPTLKGGANKPNLIEAQNNFARFGAMEQRFVNNIRPVAKMDVRDPLWRPIDLSRDNFERPFEPDEVFVDYPKSFVTLYYCRDTFWRRKNP